MKYLILILSLVITFSADAQSDLQVISHLNKNGTTYTVISRQGIPVDTICLYMQASEIVDFDFIAPNYVAYIIKNQSSDVFYEKHFVNDEGDWRVESSYSLGPDYQFSTESTRYTKIQIFYRLVSHDRIEKIIGTETEIVDLEKLDKLNLSMHPNKRG